MFNSTNGYSLSDIAAATGNGNSGFFGGEGGWFIWIILIFAIFWGNGWGGYGNGGFGGARETTSVYEGYVLNNDMSMLNKTITDQYQMTERKLDGIANGLSNGFYQEAQLVNGLDKSIASGVYTIQDAIQANTVAGMQNTNALQAGITGLGTQLASCCCDLRYESAKNFSDLNYRLAEQSCQTRQTVADSATAIIANQDANTRSILDFLTQDKIASLTSENAALKAAANNAAQTQEIVTQLMPKAPIAAYTVPNPYCNCNCNVGCGC